MSQKPFISKVIAISLLVLTVATSHAITPNSEDPITIEADHAQIDEKNGLSTYNGHVVLSQAGIKINADKLIVHHLNGRLTHITALGQPVRYRQTGIENQQDVHGEAQTMEYFAEEERLLLLESAKLSQGGNAFSGNRIEYDTKNEVVTAGVSATGKERVQVTIQPNSLKKKPANSNAADQANPAP